MEGFSVDQPEDIESIIEETERQELLEAVHSEIGLKHPIIYDSFDLCELHQQNKLNTFNVAMLKNICTELEISFKSKDRKSDILDKIKDTISSCECCLA